jgi:rhodanese-related sulfurtransferase
MRRLLLILLALCAGISAAAIAAADDDWDKLPAIKKTKAGLYLTPRQAYQRAQSAPDKTLFLDVRTRAEVSYLGMPTVADANVPYMELTDFYAWDDPRNAFKVEPNNDFAPEVGRRLEQKKLGKDDTIILICRSGDRTAKAADLLFNLGYTKVYSVPEGYEGDLAKEGDKSGQRAVNGWKNEGLPWTYKLDRQKMYKVGS